MSQPPPSWQQGGQQGYSSGLGQKAQGPHHRRQVLSGGQRKSRQSPGSWKSPL